MLRGVACVGLLVALAGCKDTIVFYDGVSVDAAVVVVADAGWQRDEWVPWQDPNCGESRKWPRFTPQWQEIFIALDRSTSMQGSFPGSTSRQSAVQGALYDAIGAVQSRVRFSIEVFPGDASGSGSGGCYRNTCCAGYPSWPRVDAQNSIGGYLLCSEQQGCYTDSSDSPSHKALEQIQEFIDYRSSHTKPDPGLQSSYVLLITASEPSCSGESGKGDACPAKTTAAQLANEDVPIVILTVGYDPRSTPGSCLVEIGSPGPDRLNTPSSYNALKDTLSGLFRSAARKSCTLALYDVIPDFATPTVTLNSSTTIPKDGPEGWSYDGPDRSKIKLSDKVCDQFANSPTATIAISYTCSTCDGPNSCPRSSY